MVSRVHFLHFWCIRDQREAEDYNLGRPVFKMNYVICE